MENNIIQFSSRKKNDFKKSPQFLSQELLNYNDFFKEFMNVDLCEIKFKEYDLTIQPYCSIIGLIVDKNMVNSLRENAIYSVLKRVKQECPVIENTSLLFKADMIILNIAEFLFVKEFGNKDLNVDNMDDIKASVLWAQSVSIIDNLKLFYYTFMNRNSVVFKNVMAIFDQHRHLKKDMLCANIKLLSPQVISEFGELYLPFIKILNKSKYFLYFEDEEYNHLREMYDVCPDYFLRGCRSLENRYVESFGIEILANMSEEEFEYILECEKQNPNILNEISALYKIDLSFKSIKKLMNMPEFIRKSYLNYKKVLNKNMKKQKINN